MEQENKTERFSINVHGGNAQIIPNAQNSTITQNNYNSNLNIGNVLSLIEAVKKAIPADFNEDKTEIVHDSLEVIETETSSPSPKKSLLRNAINTLKAIKGTAEFAAAVATLIQFIQIALK
jgi:hypothetical protein